MDDDEKTKLRVEFCLRRAEAMQQRTHGRRSAEWQINIALWGLLGLLIAGNLQGRLSGNLHSTGFPCCLLVIVHAMILVLYVAGWSAWLHHANWRDRDEAERWRKKASDYVDDEKKEDFSLRKVQCQINREMGECNQENPPKGIRAKSKTWAKGFWNHCKKSKRVLWDGKRCNISGISQVCLTLILVLVNVLLWTSLSP
jgi:hypothetical protein